MDIKTDKERRERRAIYLGIILIASGIIFNKWFIEITIVPDRAIESLRLIIVIAIFEVIAIVLGAFFLIQRPVMRGPSRSKTALICASLFFVFLIFETGARIWLNFIADPADRQNYAIYSDLSPSEFQRTRHHYLNYYPTPSYKLGMTSHNSLGFREREFPLQKPDGAYRIAVIGGSSTYTIQVEDNERTFTAQLEKILGSRYGYGNVEVINAGVSGCNSW